MQLLDTRPVFGVLCNIDKRLETSTREHESHLAEVGDGKLML
jgi:hypothetical protein